VLFVGEVVVELQCLQVPIRFLKERRIGSAIEKKWWLNFVW